MVGVLSWTVLLAIFPPHSSQLRNQIDEASTIAEKVISSIRMMEDLHGPPPRPPKEPSQKVQWHCVLPIMPLLYYKDVACTKMSRITLIEFVLLSPAREEYRHDGAAGLRLVGSATTDFVSMIPITI